MTRRTLNITASRELAVIDFLEHAQRRVTLLLHGFDRDIERLFEQMLTAKRGMHYSVGKDEPRRLRWKLDSPLQRRALIVLIKLGLVVQVEHDVVVGAAAASRYMQALKQPGAARHLRWHACMK